MHTDRVKIIALPRLCHHDNIVLDWAQRREPSEKREGEDDVRISRENVSCKKWGTLRHAHGTWDLAREVNVLALCS